MSDEVMGFKDHFSVAADRYAAYRPSYPAALADFLARAAPRPALAWDCGCGSGQLSALLAERFESVWATDASAEQIARATPHPRIEYRKAGEGASGLPNGCVDLAVAAQAAHWFDLAAYYAEVRRVARPGAIIAQTVYNLVEVTEEVDLAVRRFYADVLGPYWPPERRHVEVDYASLPFPFEPVPAPPLEMHATYTLAHFIEYVRTWSATIALEQAEGTGPLEEWRRELEPLWDAGTRDRAREVRWPLTVRAGRV